MAFIIELSLAASLFCNACVLFVLSSRVCCDRIFNKLQEWPKFAEVSALHNKHKWMIPFILGETVIVLTIVTLAIITMVTSDCLISPLLNRSKNDNFLHLADILVAETAVCYLYRLGFHIAINNKAQRKLTIVTHHVIAVVCYATASAFRENRLLVISSTFSVVIELIMNFSSNLYKLPLFHNRSTKCRSHSITLVYIVCQIIGMIICLLCALLTQNPMNMSLPSVVMFFISLLFYTSSITCVCIYHAFKLCKMFRNRSVVASKPVYPLLNRHGAVIPKSMTPTWLMNYELLRPQANKNLCGDSENDQKNNQAKKDVSKIPNELLDMLNNKNSLV